VTTSGAGGGKLRGELKIRVKTARKRSHASTLWLERQLNDPYVAQAKKDGYRSRAAYKLLEIDERYRILKPGQRIVDLGAAPGGWSQIAAKKIGAGKGGGKIIGIDLLPIDPLAGVHFEILDFLDPSAPERLKAMLGGQADLVLSDMAANTTGHKKTDQLRIIGMVELAADFACEVLADGGTFLAKVFQGGTENELLATLKKSFASVHHVKPQASRVGSAELYVLAKGFRGAMRRQESREPDEPAGDWDPRAVV
jgi:23S rRNA (uridine2552-2'-O)-methyltransferase